MSEENQTTEPQVSLNSRVENALLSRSINLLENLIDPRRDIYHECGFPKDITDEMIDLLYRRNGLASKVNDLWPNHSWKTTPEISSVKDKGQEQLESDFDKAFFDLHGQMRIDDIPEDTEETGWFKSEKSSPVWEVLKQADIDSGIGVDGYSVILLGFDDDQDLKEPVVKGTAKKLLFAESYPSTSVSISKTDNDETSKRFGLPTAYNISIEQCESGSSVVKDTEVHHTRVIHIFTDTKKKGSRLERTYNAIHGSEKIIGASPEGYFRMAFTKLLLESNPGTTAEDFDQDKLNKQIDKYKNSMDGVLSLFGMTGKSVAPEVLDPLPFFNLLIDFICITEDVPKRIFAGSERGELASSQDKQEWNERVSERQIKHVSGSIISKFINRLIWAGVLPEPKIGFEITWPSLNELDESTSADVAVKRTQAMAAFVSSGIGDTLMTPFDFLTMELNYTDDEARKIIDNFDNELDNRLGDGDDVVDDSDTDSGDVESDGVDT